MGAVAAAVKEAKATESQPEPCPHSGPQTAPWTSQPCPVRDSGPGRRGCGLVAPSDVSSLLRACALWVTDSWHGLHVEPWTFLQPRLLVAAALTLTVTLGDIFVCHIWVGNNEIEEAGGGGVFMVWQEWGQDAQSMALLREMHGWDPFSSRDAGGGGLRASGLTLRQV